ncbi:hypothetical protein [Alienimonas sp. DA493]|uniref:hypothetical protein n=1 Tax=Alienimonas sp. DA493 TaxID=3373605 RepID=UPI003753F002
MTRSTLLKTLVAAVALRWLVSWGVQGTRERRQAREEEARLATQTILHTLAWHQLWLFERGEPNPLLSDAPLGNLAASAGRLRPEDDWRVSADWFHHPAISTHGPAARDGWGRPLRLVVPWDETVRVSSAGRDGVHGTDDDLAVSLHYRSLHRDRQPEPRPAIRTGD